MTNKNHYVSLTEATEQVEIAITRLALLHLSFSRILMNELGEKKGADLIIKSIMEYGKRIEKIISTGGYDLPKWGVHSGSLYQDEEGHFIVSGCNLAKVFKQFNELHLGRYYCYVDAAKSMASDPYEKSIHLTCEACGDENCTFDVALTTKEEREDFKTGEITYWQHSDPRLMNFDS